MTEKLKTLILVGSAREKRMADRVMIWLTQQFSLYALFDVTIVDARDHADKQPTNFRSAADNADCVIVVTPEYNHSFPAPLKAMVDSVYSEWNGKPVGFVSYGGISGGLRAVEQLRLVFAELHMVSVRDTVSIVGPWNAFSADGVPNDPRPLNEALDKLLHSLAWWASALKAARNARPYGQIAA
jgi:NAD(P)H-dependent FMN reductase